MAMKTSEARTVASMLLRCPRGEVRQARLEQLTKKDLILCVDALVELVHELQADHMGGVLAAAEALQGGA